MCSRSIDGGGEKNPPFQIQMFSLLLYSRFSPSKNRSDFFFQIHHFWMCENYRCKWQSVCVFAETMNLKKKRYVHVWDRDRIGFTEA